MLHEAAEQLAKWGLSEQDANRLGFFDVADASQIYPDFRKAPAIVIPYYEPDNGALRLMTFDRDGVAQKFCRVRYLDKPALNFKGKAEAPKYGQPKASGQRVYFPPLLDWPTLLNDTQEPLIITEGEAKAASGVLAGYPVIALGGVFNFMQDFERLLRELESIDWKGRIVWICFDSDAVDNPNILTAEARLVDELQRKRGADCRLVRLPQDGQHKVGLDDFLRAHGSSAFYSLLKAAPSLGAMDAKVVSLNKSVAWISAEGLVYDLEEKRFLKKDNFINGERYGSLTHITTGGGNSRTPKRISVAKAWLTHPHAQRFSECLFRPDGGPVVDSDAGRPALNLFTGYVHTPGNVGPFLTLTEFLFQDMRPEDRDLPLKLMAYKAQNPAEKIPLALVLIGMQGSGKSLWSNSLYDAFHPWSTVVTSKSFSSEFQGWMERSLLAVIHEAEDEDMLRGADVLKSLISDLERPMNEKYRPARIVKSYTSYILTSNRRAVGAFSADDRRMIVVNCPAKHPAGLDFYGPIAEWKEKHEGGKHLMDWLLRYDLRGWRPPVTAPMSAEKHMAYMESLTPVARLAAEMQSTTGWTAVHMWLASALQWAKEAELSPVPHIASTARAIAQNVSRYQIRPWYTPEELTLMFPAIVQQVYGSKLAKTTPSGQISRELREAGVPYLLCADSPLGFKWRGRLQQYLVVSDPQDWKAPLKQADFERLMNNWPTLADIAR